MKHGKIRFSTIAFLFSIFTIGMMACGGGNDGKSSSGEDTETSDDASKSESESPSSTSDNDAEENKFEKKFTFTYETALSNFHCAFDWPLIAELWTMGAEFEIRNIAGDNIVLDGSITGNKYIFNLEMNNDGGELISRYECVLETKISYARVECRSFESVVHETIGLQDDQSGCSFTLDK